MGGPKGSGWYVNAGERRLLGVEGGTDAEGPARPGDDDGPHRLVRLEGRRGRVPELEPHPRRKGVHLLGAVQGDEGDARVHLDQQYLVGSLTHVFDLVPRLVAHVGMMPIRARARCQFLKPHTG